jgi:hypothetical protein
MGLRSLSGYSKISTTLASTFTIQYSVTPKRA